MFLNGNQILEMLREGKLVIEPFPDEDQLYVFALQLRLGTQFFQFPLPKKGVTLDVSNPFGPFGIIEQFEEPNFFSIEVGQSISLSPGSRLLATTFEYIKMPDDLAGFIFPLSSLQRVGLLVIPSMIFPGWHGKLSLSLDNIGNMELTMNPGHEIANLLFAPIEQTIATESLTEKLPKAHAKLELVPELIQEQSNREIEELKTLSIRELLNLALETKGNQKGRALESLAEVLFESIEGLEVIGKNVRLSAEELDLLVQNNRSDTGFWTGAGSLIVVECKNWSKRVGAREISILFDKLESISPEAKTGILIAPNGVSGDFYKDAILKIREKRQRGRYIIVLDHQALEEVAHGADAAIVIEKKYHDLILLSV